MLLGRDLRVSSSDRTDVKKRKNELVLIDDMRVNLVHGNPTKEALVRHGCRCSRKTSALYSPENSTAPEWEIRDLLGLEPRQQNRKLRKCPPWVKMRNTHGEHLSSEMTPKADIAADVLTGPTSATSRRSPAASW